MSNESSHPESATPPAVPSAAPADAGKSAEAPAGGAQADTPPRHWTEDCNVMALRREEEDHRRRQLRRRNSRR